MYLVYCLLIWVFVYSLPGIAFFPQLITSPRTAFALPILSVCVIYMLSSLFLALGLLTTTAVTIIALSLGSVAFWRMRKVIANGKFSWVSQDVFIYLFHGILLFPYFIKLGTHAFERGDEIYSWNFWAIQHYFLEPIDFSHTGAPYPQLFPKLLAFCYHLVGDLELQLPVRATLIIFPWAMLTAIAMAYRQRMAAHLGTYLVLLLYVLAFVGLEQFFDDGYADPVMSGCLLVSAVLFWQSQQRPTFQVSPFILALCACLCAITAAHAKQPALLWVLFSLPVLLWIKEKSPQKLHYRLLSLLLIAGGLWWILGEGQEFHLNKGVIWLSLADRDFVSQLMFSINKYFIHQPFLFLLFLLAWISCRSDSVLRNMVIFFMIPSMICWFLFGAYHLRLGQHLIAFSFFVIGASGYALPAKITNWEGWQRFWNWLGSRQKACFVGIVSISVVMGGLLFIQGAWLEKGRVSLYSGGRLSLQRYFGKDSDFIYNTVYRDKNALLWVPSRYIYGLFYKRTQLTTPDYPRYPLYDQAALIDELQRKLPDYAFTVSEAVIDGPGSERLSEVIAACPNAFEKIASSPNRFNFVTYKINKNLLQKDPCLLNLVTKQRPQKEAHLQATLDESQYGN
ncbi:MAG: hypothetical protein JSS07_08865 [Proteobacteria bacterium]|nr:hypothetical protein [Pseudomonadota bacterium]